MYGLADHLISASHRCRSAFRLLPAGFEQGKSAFGIAGPPPMSAKLKSPAASGATGVLVGAVSRVVAPAVGRSFCAVTSTVMVLERQIKIDDALSSANLKGKARQRRAGNICRRCPGETDRSMWLPAII